MRMLLSDIWSRSNFWVTVHLPGCWCRQNNRSWILRTRPFIDWINHFCCKCWFHSLDLIWHCLSDSDDICDPKCHIKCPRNFRPSPWILPINYEMKELIEGPELGFRKESMCWSGLRCWVYSRCSTFMLKKFTFSLSKNVTLNFLLVWTSFFFFFFKAFSSRCVCSLCVWTKFPRDAGRNSPNVVEIPPNHVHQKNNVFFHIHEINRGSCIVY